MRPIILQGHTRPVTRVKFNLDGDLLFSSSKDKSFNVWCASTGKLLGSYEGGHSGVVADFDIDPTSTLALTGSADTTAILWEVTTGKQLYKWTWKSPVRSVAFAPEMDMALIITDRKLGAQCSIYVVPIALDIEDISEVPLSIIFPGTDLSPISVARWGPNGTIYAGHENGLISYWEALSGLFLGKKELHKLLVCDLQFAPDLSYFVTASKDFTAKLISLDLKVNKTYTTERPVYSAAITPYRPHIILGGGPDASVVTQTHGGKFESRFFHKILEQEIGRIKGHFGPINTIAVHPEGISFASGGEDGNVRLHHFDPDYFEFKLDPRDA